MASGTGGRAAYGGAMPVLVILGAGPGLGAASARRFAREGFAVALVARDAERLGALRDALAADGVRASAHPADLTDPAAVRTALDAAAAEHGAIDVVQYSPIPSRRLLKPVLETDTEDLEAALDLSVRGPVTAIRHVLPGMLERGAGSVLLVNGGSAATPNGRVAGTSVAFAGESAYGAMLHEAVAEQGVRVRQLIVPGEIGGGDPLFEPDALAERLWGLHAESGPFRATVGG